MKNSVRRFQKICLFISSLEEAWPRSRENVLFGTTPVRREEIKEKMLMRLDIRQVQQDQATDKVPAPGFEPGEQRVEIRIPGVESVDL